MTDQNSHMDRRRHPRISRKIQFEISTEDSVIVAETLNISCSGACCKVNKHLPLMTRLRVAFALPSHDGKDKRNYVECFGVVVRVEEIRSPEEENSYHIAIFFNNIDNINQKKIVNFIDAHLKSSSN